MAKLTTGERSNLPKKEFALPGGRFPINDESHGRAALSMAHNASPAEQDTIREKVHAKFPDIESGKGPKKHTGYGGKVFAALVIVCLLFSSRPSFAASGKAITCSTVLGGPPCSGGLGSVCVNLTFVPVTGVAGYNLYRGPSTGGENLTQPINQSLIAGNTFQDSTLPSGATVAYYVATSVNSGGVQSTVSNEACAQILVPPAPPTNLQATPQ